VTQQTLLASGSTAVAEVLVESSTAFPTFDTSGFGDLVHEAMEPVAPAAPVHIDMPEHCLAFLSAGKMEYCQAAEASKGENFHDPAAHTALPDH